MYYKHKHIRNVLGILKQIYKRNDTFQLLIIICHALSVLTSCLALSKNKERKTVFKHLQRLIWLCLPDVGSFFCTYIHFECAFFYNIFLLLSGRFDVPLDSNSRAKRSTSTHLHTLVFVSVISNVKCSF